MNREDFDAGWDRLIDALHKGKEATQAPRAKEYALSLRHLPADAWMAAVERSVRELRFFPAVSELLKFSRDHLELTGAVLTNDRAWVETHRALLSYVPAFRENVEYPNAACREAVKRMGGPSTIAMCNPKDIDHKRREFIRFYENLCMSAEALGADVRGLVNRRYVLRYTGYRMVAGKAEPFGRPFVLDRETGQSVPPHFLELEGEDGQRELAEWRRHSALTSGGVLQLAPVADRGSGGDRTVGTGAGTSGESSRREDHASRLRSVGTAGGTGEGGDHLGHG